MSLDPRVHRGHLRSRLSSSTDDVVENGAFSIALPDPALDHSESRSEQGAVVNILLRVAHS